MKERRIKLVSIADAKAFVTAAMKCDFDVDVFYNRVVIDGKSILGVLSMDLTKILNVRLHGENKEFEDFLETLVPMDEKNRVKQNQQYKFMARKQAEQDCVRLLFICRGI